MARKRVGDAEGRATRGHRLTIHPLTPEFWPSLMDLFGKPGASNGCWCMYWRVGRAYRDRGNERNRQDFAAVVRRGPPPGLLAFAGDRAVGWCQVTPRVSLPHLDGLKAFGVGEPERIWSVSCFFIRREHRRRGVGRALLAAAIRFARDGGATALEAYPVEVLSPGTRRDWYTGYVSMFTRAGFRKVGSRRPDQPVMQRKLRTTRSSSA